MSWSLRLNIAVAIIAELFRAWRSARQSSKAISRTSFSEKLSVSHDFHHEQQRFNSRTAARGVTESCGSASCRRE